ncbi:Helicase associated domain protein [Cupriavidus sp. CuC1]|uniref:helicase associated domain-containing protein n=1 Tax=Cupriavidus sp. CuC1 TaxID=3373131 RepID=UPI0037D181BE
MVVDMSDEAWFGPRFHTLTFSEAIRHGLLSDYRVVVMLIDDTEIHSLLKTLEQSKADPSSNDTWKRAAQVGLLKAVRQFDLRRVISFHRYVNSAHTFARELPAVSKHLSANGSDPGRPKADHVSGAMSAQERKRKLADFSGAYACDYRILTNARCLTEGVDVADIDGIAFIDPRGSDIDIIQALGRAIRKHERKEYGTIVLPVFLGKGDTPAEAIDKTNFKPVWDVLNALRSHDADFETALNARRQVEGGAAPGDADPLAKIQWVGAEHIPGLAEALEPLLVGELTDGWEVGYGAANARWEKYGNCNAPKRSVWPEGDLVNGFRLGDWLNLQRSTRRAGQLSREREDRLTRLGMVWAPWEATWEEGFLCAEGWNAHYGNCNAPASSRWPEGAGNGFRLGQWLDRQRKARKGGMLSEERVRRLESIGIVWEQRQAAWEAAYCCAVGWHAMYGDCNVPGHCTWPPEDPKGFRLGLWIRAQRQTQTTGTLNVDRIQRLEALGMKWEALPAAGKGQSKAWEKGFDFLSSWHAINNNCDVPPDYKWPDTAVGGFGIGQWVIKQRKKKRSGKLSAEQIQRLEALGFVLNKPSAEWEKAFAYAADRASVHGHCNVPVHFAWQKGNDEPFPLGKWLSTQRQAKRASKLSVDRERRLDSIGMVWDRSRN